MNWCLDISKMEAENMLNDIVKMITQILVVHFLTYSIDNQGSFMDIKIVKILLYATISMIIYNLFTKRLFKPNNLKNWFLIQLKEWMNCFYTWILWQTVDYLEKIDTNSITMDYY